MPPWGMMVDYHLLKRTDSKGKTVYYAGFLSEKKGKNGKTRYRSVKSTGTGNKALAHKLARQMMQEGSVLASRDSLADYLRNFWDEKKSEYLRSRQAETGRTYSASYLMSNKQVIEDYFLPYCKEHNLVKLSDLTAKNLEAWRNYLSLDCKGVTPRTVNRTRQAVWVALNYAVDIGLLPYHPGIRVKKVREKPAEREIFEILELTKLFETPWPDPRSYAAAMLSVTTGTRLGEIRGLLFQNLHLDNGYFDIVTSWQDLEGLKPPKWGSERLGVPIPDRVVDVLENLGKINRWGKKPENFVFFDMHSPRRPVSSIILTGGLKRAMKAAKIPAGRTFHCFRHTFISHASGSLSPAALRYHVGHSNEITTERYQHITAADKKAVKSLGDSFFGGTVIEDAEKVEEVSQ